jgi:hypothetical protein
MPNTANAVTKLRYLGPFERFLWLVDLTEPMHFAVAAQFECLVSIDKWEEALRALQQRHPLLRSSIKLDENSIPFFCEAGCVPSRGQRQQALTGRSGAGGRDCETVWYDSPVLDPRNVATRCARLQLDLDRTFGSRARTAPRVRRRCTGR